MTALWPVPHICYKETLTSVTSVKQRTQRLRAFKEWHIPVSDMQQVTQNTGVLSHKVLTKKERSRNTRGGRSGGYQTVAIRCWACKS